MAKQRAICPKCFEVKVLTRHHVLPKRHFGFNHCTISICRECHDEIEAIVPKYRKLERDEYFSINRIWLRGFYPKVVGR